MANSESFRPGTTAIAIAPEAHNVVIQDVLITGSDIGIRSEGATGLIAKDVSFRGVSLPFDIKGEASISGTKISSDPKIRSSSRGRSMIGWTSIKGPALPSYCDECGNVFASQNYDLAGPYFNLWRNEDTCIVCGNEHAKLSQGHFDLARDTVRILRAPDITKEMLQRLSEIGAGALFGKLKPETAVALAQKVHPSFGDLLRRYISTGRKAGMLFLAAVGALVTLSDGAELVGITDPDVVNQKVLEEVLSKHESMWTKQLEKMNVQQNQDSRTSNDPADTPNKAGHEPGSSDQKIGDSSMPDAKIMKSSRKVKNRLHNSMGRSRTR
ncbi:hypothetical protein [Pararhizobium sp. O133]|uniref:hypothetical protein n=1 Tax=Pararhizobium sp. O133 TaxID=3449278 RepID=UPI003F6891E2